MHGVLFSDNFRVFVTNNLLINHHHTETIDHDCEQMSTLITDSGCSVCDVLLQIL